jgi:hypothetical protein|tara:strand:+ start:1335 stop:1766 length:432 start_codon:yes stop_codon:yes gene_type:complete
MSILKTLKLAEKEKGQADPFRSARTRLIQNLETQLKCAEAMIKGETYMQARMETVEENGTKVRKTVNRPVRHWYWRDREGMVRFCIRVLNKRIEIDQGKTDIIVGKDEDLPKTVKSLLDAVNAGDFDEHLKHAVAQRKKRKAG